MFLLTKPTLIKVYFTNLFISLQAINCPRKIGRSTTHWCLYYLWVRRRWRWMAQGSLCAARWIGMDMDFVTSVGAPSTTRLHAKWHNVQKTGGNGAHSRTGNLSITSSWLSYRIPALAIHILGVVNCSWKNYYLYFAFQIPTMELCATF